MAAIGSAQVTVLSDDGVADRWVAYKLKNIATLDTLDASGRFAGYVESGAFLTSQTTNVGAVASSSLGLVELTLAGTTAAVAFLILRGDRSS